MSKKNDRLCLTVVRNMIFVFVFS